jgi:signal transduction histidine kinase
LPLLPIAPALVVLVGLAVAIAMALAGVADLRRAGDEAAALRADALASTLAARLHVTGSEDRAEVVQGAGRGAYADILLIDYDGKIHVDASVLAPSRADLLRCLVAGTGEMKTALGRARYAVRPLGPPLDALSVLAMVPAPLTPPEAQGLIRAVATLAALLVGAAAFVAIVFANDVRSDVMYVRTRIARMAEPETDPAGAPIPVRALDQVGVLTSAFNLLVDRFAVAERSYRQDLALASALDRERSAFLAAVSHELRTPLNAVLGFTDVLLSDADGPLDSGTREDLDVIRTSAGHLRSLIDDILELSMLESGELELSKRPVDVFEITEQVVREARPMAAAKQLRIELSGHHGLVANADPRRLRQILDNIIGNAVKFTARGGVAIAVERSGPDIVVHTVDTGPGIAPGAQAEIFEEYSQAGDNALRRKGTGLGLAIARKLVMMHAGEIELESELGRGSRFSIRLRADEGAT